MGLAAGASRLTRRRARGGSTACTWRRCPSVPRASAAPRGCAGARRARRRGAERAAEDAAPLPPARAPPVPPRRRGRRRRHLRLAGGLGGRARASAGAQVVEIPIVVDPSERPASASPAGRPSWYSGLDGVRRAVTSSSRHAVVWAGHPDCELVVTGCGPGTVAALLEEGRPPASAASRRGLRGARPAAAALMPTPPRCSSPCSTTALPRALSHQDRRVPRLGTPRGDHSGGRDPALPDRSRGRPRLPARRPRGVRGQPPRCWTTRTLPSA